MKKYIPLGTVKQNLIFKKVIEKEIDVYPNNVPIVDGFVSDDELENYNNYLLQLEAEKLIECNKEENGYVLNCCSTNRGFGYYFNEMVPNKVELKKQIEKEVERRIENSSQISDSTNIPKRIVDYVLEELSKQGKIDLHRIDSGEYLISY